MAEILKRRADRQCRAGAGAGVAGDALSPVECYPDRVMADRDGRAQRRAEIEPSGIALRTAPAAGAEIECQPCERAERPRRADCAVGESFHPVFFQSVKSVGELAGVGLQSHFGQQDPLPSSGI